ncbi:hypothetical protein [Sporomusa acidovorans]|uniref:Uncharacterized protein n=1 Tax=Sporomusa acidovorans (strain ATCC 49682 / DSM 3132 / Mol) TaxID=1123286 RepID=A0ABZ3J781_SPOA4|nr:hypothetical protein [Sporomusa acidovorans]OZC24186.1 hypothetical protein SPACI_01610 [Sporomusa acidovorans DSM 3132]SDF77712.1 hypothetical protein SAMN04488499_108112 [Sporomusa acidovorans]
MIKCQNECPKEKGKVCCSQCEFNTDCDDLCELEPNDCGCAVLESTPDVFQTAEAAVIQSIADLCKFKKDLEEKEKDLKSQLKDAMERHSIKSFNNDVLKITYVAGTSAVSIDSKALKAKYPQIAAECSKTSTKAAYVKVELK